jgi:hypothetical protein
VLRAHVLEPREGGPAIPLHGDGRMGAELAEAVRDVSAVLPDPGAGLLRPIPRPSRQGEQADVMRLEELALDHVAPPCAGRGCEVARGRGCFGSHSTAPGRFFIERGSVCFARA